MIDVSEKKSVLRQATAKGCIRLKPESISMILSGKVKKGDVLETAKIAAIMGSKNTPSLVPYCHSVPLESVNVEFTVGDETVECVVKVKAHNRTGVEMEALTGVSAALLTIWDMVKYMEKDEKGQYPNTRIVDVRVLEKNKGE